MKLRVLDLLRMLTLSSVLASSSVLAGQFEELQARLNQLDDHSPIAELKRIFTDINAAEGPGITREEASALRRSLERALIDRVDTIMNRAAVEGNAVQKSILYMEAYQLLVDIHNNWIQHTPAILYGNYNQLIQQVLPHVREEQASLTPGANLGGPAAPGSDGPGAGLPQDLVRSYIALAENPEHQQNFLAFQAMMAAQFGPRTPVQTRRHQQEGEPRPSTSAPASSTNLEDSMRAMGLQTDRTERPLPPLPAMPAFDPSQLPALPSRIAPPPPAHGLPMGADIPPAPALPARDSQRAPAPASAGLSRTDTIRAALAGALQPASGASASFPPPGNPGSADDVLSKRFKYPDDEHPL